MTRRRHLACAFRDEAKIRAALSARSFAVGVGPLARLTGIPERRLRRLLDAMGEAGLVGLAPLDGRARFYWREDPGREDPGREDPGQR